MNSFFISIRQCLSIAVVALALTACATTDSPTVAATPEAAMSMSQDPNMAHEGAMEDCCCKKMMKSGKMQCKTTADGKKSCCSGCCKKSAVGGMQCDPAMVGKKSGAQVTKKK